MNDIQDWREFRYDRLSKVFRKELRIQMDKWKFTSAFDAGQTNVIVDESSLELALSGHAVLVSGAIATVKPGWFLGKGARIASESSAKPDWGIANAHKLVPGSKYICQARCVGETKLGWDSRYAKALMEKFDSYERNPTARSAARPYEQIQFYCEMYKTRYGWLVTDTGITVVRATLAKSRSSPPRTRMQDPSHVRGLSDDSIMSGISESLSQMSFTSHSTHDVGCLEAAFIPWKCTNERDMTPDVALLFLALLADVDSLLYEGYAPLGDVTKRQAASVTDLGVSRHISTTETPAPPPQLFIPQEGIAADVIEADIDYHIPGAKVSAKGVRNGDQTGYLISLATQWNSEEAKRIITALIQDTRAWENLKQKSRHKIGPYKNSAVYRKRRGQGP